MNDVRAFREQDIPDVARLWLRVFRRLEAPAAAPLQEYFRDILLRSPWADPELPSLVYEESGLGVAGFLGVMPRAMRFRNERVRAAIATQLVVDPRARGYAGARLLRRFFAGPQALSFSDGANEHAERLWRGCGGSVALLYSLTWTRVLQPVQYLLTRLGQRGGRSALAARVLRPAGHALDRAATLPALRRHWLPDGGRLVLDASPSDETLLWCIRHLDGEPALRPDYDLDRLAWLLARAGEKRMHGRLQRAVARLPRGDIAGWFLYYLAPGATAEVLQFGAHRRAATEVLECLFHRARAQGALAVSGEVEPRYIKEMAVSRCHLACPGYGVLAHSRRPEILEAVHAGNAFLSRLEGEWWARFSDPDWSSRHPPPDSPVAGFARLRARAAQCPLPDRKDVHERATA